MLRICLIALSITLAVPASAAKVGDIVFLSKSAGLILTKVKNLDKDTVQMTGIQMQSNAAEFCRRYENLRPTNPRWSRCIRENVETIPTTITMSCLSSTMIISGGRGGAGAYRRVVQGGPWVSVSEENLIALGDEAFEVACRQRSH